MVLTINSFISILQTINVLWERGKRGKSLEFWLKIPAAVSRALMIHGRPLSCLKVNSLLMVCPLPGPDTECRSCLWGERGPGGGARQPGSFSGQWLCYLRSLSGLIGPKHDTRAIVNNGISPNWELGKIHLSQKCYIIEHQQQMQIVHCVLNKHWSIFWLPVLFLLSIFDDNFKFVFVKFINASLSEYPNL